MDRHARDEAELDRLPRDRERARDHRLAGDHRRKAGNDQQGPLEPVGREIIERADQRGLPFAHQQRGLPQIVEHERGQHQRQPRDADRVAPEMAHVGIERLGARHRQNRRAHREEAPERIGREHRHRMMRAERKDHAGQRHDADQPEHGDRAEIEQHDRPEEGRHALGPAPLDQEQPDQDRHHHRHDPDLHARLVDREAFHRAHDRDRRGDHRIAIEQRRGKDPEQDDPASPALARRVLVDQREQGQAAALALVVGPHDHGDVLERHDDHHRPEHQADDAVDVRLVERKPVVPGKRVAQGVERAGADVAKDDPHRAHGHLEQAGIVAMMAPVIARNGFGLRSSRPG